MTTTLDTKDRKILSELDMDARQSLTLIAKKVRLSREVVTYRIAQMEKNGVIEGYYAAIDVTKLGYMFCRVLLRYRNMTPQKEKELLEYCKKSKRINWVIQIGGRWDLVIVILAKSLNIIEQLMDELSFLFGKYFQDPLTTFALSIFHYKHNYLYDTKKYEEVILGEEKPIPLSHIDFQILKILAKSGRGSLQEIAHTIQVSPKAVAQHIKQLIKKKIIIAFRAKISLRTLGYDHYKIFLTLQDLTIQNKRKLMTFLRFHQNVIYVTKPLGEHNLEFEIIVRNAKELHEHLKQLTFEFSHIIVNHEILLNYAEPILKYLPEL